MRHFNAGEVVEHALYSLSYIHAMIRSNMKRQVNVNNGAQTCSFGCHVRVRQASPLSKGAHKRKHTTKKRRKKSEFDTNQYLLVAHGAFVHRVPAGHFVLACSPAFVSHFIFRLLYLTCWIRTCCSDVSFPAGGASATAAVPPVRASAKGQDGVSSTIAAEETTTPPSAEQSQARYRTARSDVGAVSEGKCGQTVVGW